MVRLELWNKEILRDLKNFFNACKATGYKENPEINISNEGLKLSCGNGFRWFGEMKPERFLVFETEGDFTCSPDLKDISSFISRKTDRLIIKDVDGDISATYFEGDKEIMSSQLGCNR